jgi:hypothetical protein
VAVKFAGSTSLDCVTMDGDCVSNRGMGVIDNKHSTDIE